MCSMLCVSCILSHWHKYATELIVNCILYYIGVDSGWDVILVFKNERRAVLKCSSKYKLSNSARIAGTLGCVEVVAPTYIN